MLWPLGSFSRQPDLCLANTFGECDLAMGIITAGPSLGGGILLRIALKNGLYSRILKFYLEHSHSRLRAPYAYGYRLRYSQRTLTAPPGTMIRVRGVSDSGLYNPYD